MCGIAGILDLAGERTAPEGAIEAMAQALIHRGPDEEGYFRRNGVQLASRRLRSSAWRTASSRSPTKTVPSR
jgi:asparagine synthase (glutamine-hydrolysing)